MRELVQAELPLQIPICAWCKPRSSDTEIIHITHGICPRHLRQIKKESQKLAHQVRSEAQVPQNETAAVAVS